MDIGRAFDALQESAAASCQVYEQWHSMVTQVGCLEREGGGREQCEKGWRKLRGMKMKMMEGV